MKSKYNPFKMIGSWVGAVILPAIILLSNSITDKEPFMIKEFLLSLFNFNVENSIGIPALFAWGIIIVGFLLGWGINSLYRRFK